MEIKSYNLKDFYILLHYNVRDTMRILIKFLRYMKKMVTFHYPKCYNPHYKYKVRTLCGVYVICMSKHILYVPSGVLFLMSKIV